VAWGARGRPHRLSDSWPAAECMSSPAARSGHLRTQKQQVRTTISRDLDFWDSWLRGLFKRVRGEMYEMG
jgi:hypothetical protein